MTEAEFQSDLIREMQADGYTVLKLDPGTGNIPKSWPDLCILGPKGYVLWCEVKEVGGTAGVGPGHLEIEQAHLGVGQGDLVADVETVSRATPQDQVVAVALDELGAHAQIVRRLTRPGRERQVLGQPQFAHERGDVAERCP